MGELAIELKGLLQEMAALLEIGDDTFAKIRVSAGFPEPVMVGQGDKSRRWKKADNDAP